MHNFFWATISYKYHGHVILHLWMNSSAKDDNNSNSNNCSGYYIIRAHEVEK